ncbi:MFS transporter [Pseudonocardia benzenivorans]|uniref:Major facilitator superfamily MFS_1 n=2 Tax=Pseudonocardia TaxID=1847 RepID=F4CXV3_PSEUX|nr:MFS transporter [Pseudonocardia dioxanivorans]AEA28759.1 major facilitator superfamily MFS_1 [Pseudonocardia dioxanivorans CB1190]GJF01618.1 MFS transporter [Pseudonocardia sp. D17]
MSSSSAATTGETTTVGAREKAGLSRLLRSPGYGRLLAVRFATQFGDGLFQAALGGAVLFNPERQADPLAVAAGLAVILLPYSVIGPFTGALLDRWDRRRVLVVANLVRVLLIVAVAVLVGTGAGGVPLYLAALAVAGASRFVLSGLSAGLPHVVEPRHLVEANTIAATAGAATAALGGATAIGLRAVIGSGNSGSALVTAIALAGPLVAALVAAGFRRGSLGPDRVPASDASAPATPAAERSATRVVVHGMTDGLRAVAATPTVAASFAALMAHRLAFGIGTLVSLLLFRYAFADSGVLRAGMTGVGEAVVLAAAGLGVAALLTPWLVHRIGRAMTVRLALGASVLTQIGLAAFLGMPAVLAAAFLLGATGQIVKLCTDAAVQSETGDDVRGRVFALYDALFNISYVVAVAAAALLSPPDGWAPGLLGAAAGIYVIGLVAHELQLRRRASGS